MSIFSKKNEEKRSIDKALISGMTEQKLYTLFTQKAWKQLDANTRLALLQEVENRRAALDGRPAIRIESMEAAPNELGVCCRSDKDTVLRINSRYLKGSGVVHSGAGALTTVLHEGRHAYQFHATQRLEREKASAEVLEWAVSQTCYITAANSYLLYQLQSIEMDARRFARREMQRIGRMLQREGVLDLTFATQISYQMEVEKNLIASVRKHLTLDKVNELESGILALYKEYNPNVDVSGVRLFENARLILTHPEITRLEELVNQLDAQADNKLRGPDTAALHGPEEAFKNAQRLRVASSLRIV